MVMNWLPCMFLSSGQYKTSIITFEELVLVSTIVICQEMKKESHKKHTFHQNDADRNQLHWSHQQLLLLLSSITQTSWPTIPHSLWVRSVCGCYLSTKRRNVFSGLLLTQEKSAPLWCKVWEQLLVLCAGSGGSIVLCVCTCVWGGCHHTLWLESTKLKDPWLP